MGKKRVFISDVHIGAGRFGDESSSRYKYDWDWLSASEARNFVRFLKHLGEKEARSIREVVLLGDIFDNWVFPHDLTPPTMDELIQAPKNEEAVKALKDLSRTVPVFFIPGNHDMQATRSVMARHFPEVIYIPEQFVAGRLVAEHGHRYTLFNAPPYFTENFGMLPLGYFLTRIESTRVGLTKSNKRRYRTYVDDFIEMLGSRTLSECVLEAVLEEAGLNHEARFEMRDGIGDAYQLSAGDVSEKYRNLLDDWPTNVVSKTRAVFAELDMLGPIGDKLCKNGRYNVCIFGHNHDATIDKDTWFVDDRIYANTGSWCGDLCTFVETEKTSGNTVVSLKKWTKNGAVKTVKRQSV